MLPDRGPLPLWFYVSLHTLVDAFGQLLDSADILAAKLAVHMAVVHVSDVVVKHRDCGG
jgi:hypothetical protein